MQKFEYMTIPAPRRAKRAKGVKGVPARFAHAVTEAMNALAADGWEYLETQMLPYDAPKGMLGGKVENFQAIMMFRRAIVHAGEVAPDLGAAAIAAPAIAALAAEDVVALPAGLETDVTTSDTTGEDTPGASRADTADNAGSRGDEPSGDASDTATGTGDKASEKTD